jgi:hypothetical protein
MTGPRTRWRLRAIGNAGIVLDRLDLELTVDTTAEAVVGAIERAARNNGILLERIPAPRVGRPPKNEPAPEGSTSPPRAAGSTDEDTP